MCVCTSINVATIECRLFYGVGSRKRSRISRRVDSTLPVLRPGTLHSRCQFLDVNEADSSFSVTHVAEAPLTRYIGTMSR